ncbi:hypothetical protein DFP93_1159 [Aneurinibacillus soli]|uniref:Uncharacterized protein n=1 Tax=Aneurinibacillus soli TaxID=1500254 RepID=A0A0U5B4Z0_9BACL|nr:hypothetical protein [Aneurinibacillus soli]PYE59854.1 hypothetical protein DFP93_1159 [Aneurinibacillus soli]BAU29424.1 hypothetical protein CB4_03624 [Aneurinibacillus soli]
MLRNKKLSGVSKPLRLVEQVLGDQGFQRKGSKEAPVYRMNILDAATHQSYALEIPFREERKKDDHLVRLGDAYVRTGTGEEEGVPRAVSLAAECKLSEVADYLTTYHHAQQLH